MRHSTCAVFILVVQLGLQLSTAILPVDWPALTVPDNIPLQYTGDGTYYGVGGNANGSCGFGSNGANSLQMPWTTGTTMTVAINDFQFAEGLSCGLCVKFRGTGTGIGTKPVPQTWTHAFVDNRCPECVPGSIDLAAAGDGRWQIQWVPVPCNVAESTFSYNIASDPSNPYWFSFTVSNTRIPLKNVELEASGSWSSLRRDVSNSWNANGGSYSGAQHIRLTSVLGDVVEDHIPSGGGQGTAQFPEPAPDSAGAQAGVEALTAEHPGITGPDDGPVPVYWNAPNGTWVQTSSSNPASPGAPVRLPSPGSASASAAASGSGSSPQTSTTPASSSASTSVSGSSPAQSSSGSLAAFAQCGGTYRCSSNCADAAYSNLQCGSGLTCSRYDSTWWQCRPMGSDFGSSSGSTQSSSSTDAGSSLAGAAASAAGATLAFGGNLGASSVSGGSSSSASAGSGGSAAATAGRRMLRQMQT